MTQRTDVTRALAEWVVGCDLNSIPEATQTEGIRTFVNWMGCAVGGAKHETVDRALAGVSTFSGKPTSTVLGRTEKLDALHAALLNGISSHVLDYDDTHLKTIIHPAGPVASAILAVAERQPVTGKEFLNALIVGIEVECRIGNAVYPHHYDRGWHITGTTGVMGAAAAVGRLLGLNEQQMTWALGIAATQSSGFREMFGTMTKSFHPGRAAQNGALAAYMAEANYDSSEQALEAPRGFANVMSEKQDYNEILGGLGETWEAALNSYKPFACGIVIHPTIDGCIQLAEELGEDVHAIEQLDVVAHPLVLELTGKTEPKTGLEGKFSVFHSAASALLRRDGSPTAFTDEAVNAPELINMRRRVKVKTDSACHEASVSILATLKGGKQVEKVIDRAIGSFEKPLTNDQLEHKFVDQAAQVIGKAAADALLKKTWAFTDLEDVGSLARATVPQ